MSDEGAARDKRPVVSHAVLGVALVCVAGFVDAVGFLLLAHLFTAHMSGNSAAMGAFAGQGSWSEAAHRALPIPFFVLGIGVGAALAEVACRRAMRSPLTLVMGFQAVLLSALMLFGAWFTGRGGGYVAAVALPSFTMGLQNATIRRVGSASIRTTFVSGMLTDCAESFVAWLFLIRDPDPLRKTAHLARSVLYASIWLAFAAGAVCGSLLAGRWAFHALAIPVAVLAAIAVWDGVSPLTSVGEIAPAGESCEQPASSSRAA
jgi:uncharacterized membrane protein YoaK (UPF0700 family)